MRLQYSVLPAPLPVPVSEAFSQAAVHGCRVPLPRWEWETEGQRLDGTYGSLCLNTVAVGIILVTIVLVSAALIRTLSACISLSLSTLTTLTLSRHLGILRVTNENNLFLLFRLLSRFGLLGNFRFLSLCPLRVPEPFPQQALRFRYLPELSVLRVQLLFLSEAVAYQCCRILFQRALCCLCLNSFFL